MTRRPAAADRRDVDRHQARVARRGSPLEEKLYSSIILHQLPPPEREVRLIPGRQFRCDFAWTEHRLVVEVEGGIYRGGGHTTVGGIRRDIEKANLLTLAGYRVLRVHGDQVRSGEAVALIKQALEV